MPNEPIRKEIPIDRTLDNFCPTCGSAIFQIKPNHWKDWRTEPSRIFKCLCKFKELTVNPSNQTKPEYKRRLI